MINAFPSHWISPFVFQQYFLKACYQLWVKFMSQKEHIQSHMSHNYHCAPLDGYAPPIDQLTKSGLIVPMLHQI